MLFCTIWQIEGTLFKLSNKLPDQFNNSRNKAVGNTALTKIDDDKGTFEQIYPNFLDGSASIKTEYIR